MRMRWQMNCAATGLAVVQQCGVKVHYNDAVVGEDFA